MQTTSAHVARFGYAGAAVLLVLAAGLVALFAADPSRAVPAHLGSGGLGSHLATTLLRIASALVLALIAGAAVLSSLAGRARLAAVAAITGTGTVVLSALLARRIGVGATDIAIAAAVAATQTPAVAAALHRRLSALDPELFECAAAYRFSRWTTFRHIVVPHLAPALPAIVGERIIWIWMLVLAGELVGASNGIGSQLGAHAWTLDVLSLAAYAAVGAASLLAIQFGRIAVLDRPIDRWRP